jgi:hypothetical protein
MELDLRRGVVNALALDAGVTTIVGSRIYGEESPAKPMWPFVRYGFVVSTPFRGTCWKGQASLISVHGFAKGPGTDTVLRLADAIRSALDERELPIPGSAGLLFIQFSGLQVIRDTEEASAYHAVVDFEAATAEITA